MSTPNLVFDYAHMIIVIEPDGGLPSQSSANFFAENFVIGAETAYVAFNILLEVAKQFPCPFLCFIFFRLKRFRKLEHYVQTEHE